METRGKEKQAPQNAINRNTSAGKWPLSGTGAVDILKTNHHVMIAADLFATTGFQKFYQEWILNMPYGKEKKLFIPSIDVKDIPVPAAYCGMQILQYNDCDDYRTLFRHIMDSGTWLFLTENERKIEHVIKAARESNIYLRVYGLDQEGRLKNYRIPRKEPYQSQNRLSYADIFSIPNEISPLRKVMRKTQSVPGSGSIAYTSSHRLIRLREEFISNPQSITYQTDQQGIQAKIYQAHWLTISYFEDKTKKMRRVSNDGLSS